jgi:hypothetical protein
VPPQGHHNLIDGITISCNISRGMSKTVILSCGHDCITVSIDKWKYDCTLFQVPTICTICLKCTIFKICRIGSHLSPRVVRSWISTSSLGGYLLRYRLYHRMKINVIPMSSLEGSNAGYNGCSRLCSSTSSASSPFKRNGRRRRICSISMAQTLGGFFLCKRR